MTLSVQITIIGLGMLLLAAVILAAIQKKISESHALLWIVPCILIILGGIFPQMTYLLSSFFQTEYPPAIIFAFAIIILYLILFQFFKTLSVLTIKNKELASQCAILTKEVKKLKETIQELQQEKEDEKNV